MIKIHIEVEGPDGRLETEATDVLAPMVGTSSEDLCKIVSSLTQAALKKMLGAIEA